MINQNNTGGLALDRTNHTTRPTSTRTLIDDLATLAGCYLISVPNLTPAERQFLYDIRRDEARFPVRGLERLMELSRRSLRQAHREKMPELMRTYCIPADEAMDVVAASIAETLAQGHGDITVHRFLFERTEANRIAAEDALSEHAVAVRQLLDVVKHTRIHS